MCGKVISVTSQVERFFSFYSFPLKEKRRRICINIHFFLIVDTRYMLYFMVTYFILEIYSMKYAPSRNEKKMKKKLSEPYMYLFHIRCDIIWKDLFVRIHIIINQTYHIEMIYSFEYPFINGNKLWL